MQLGRQPNAFQIVWASYPIIPSNITNTTDCIVLPNIPVLLLCDPLLTMMPQILLISQEQIATSLSLLLTGY